MNVDIRQQIEYSSSFTQVEDTLVIRYGNFLSYKDSDEMFAESFDVWWLKIHSVYLIRQVLVCWNMGEVSIPLPDNARQIILDRVHRYIGEVPVHFIVPTITNTNNDIGIEPFEILSQLLYDMHPEVHGHRKWQPDSQKCLYLVGKLRIHRYYFLRHLIENLTPEQFQYVLNRRSYNGVIPAKTDQEQFNNWAAHCAQNLLDYVDGNEMLDFLTQYETPVYDNIDLKMIDSSQLISSKMIKETALSLVSETSEWSARFISEKTYLCMATGRPFMLYHDNQANHWLETRGYKLYADYDINQKWDHRDPECTQQQLEYYTNSVRNFLATCQQRKHEIEEINTHNQLNLRRNTNVDLYKITRVFPKFKNLSKQQKINMLLTSLDETPFYNQ